MCKTLAAVYINTWTHLYTHSTYLSNECMYVLYVHVDLFLICDSRLFWHVCNVVVQRTWSES